MSATGSTTKGIPFPLREAQERKLRESIARAPLDERLQMAEALGFRDGMPLSEADIRHNIRFFKASGETSRREALAAVTGSSDIMQRCIGSLNPGEIGALFEQEWPEHRN